jgi:hypothetical protein
MRLYHILSLISLSVFVFQCGDSGKPSIKPGTPVASAPPDALFERVEAGIQFTNQLTETHQNTVLTNSYLYNGGGVGILDFNKDGLQDIFFVSTQGACQLYQNQGGFKFKEVAKAAGVEAKEGDKSGVVIVDINADGWQDIYLCKTGLQANDNRRNLLFINNKNGTFSEKAKELGLADMGASNHAAFFDADNDGDLDCYVVNYPVDFKSVNSTRLEDKGNGNVVRNTRAENYQDSDHFYLNNGAGSFADVSRKAGIDNWAFGLSVTPADINQDGFIDIVVGNDYIEPDMVYMNNPAQPGNFIDRYNETFRHSSNHTMGIDIADINNDGRADIMALDMLAETYERQKQLMTTMLLDRYTTLVKYGYGHQQMRNVLQLNNGRGSFSDIGCLAGVFQTDWSWAPLLQDFDNDGFRDMVITNGYRRDVSNLDYLNFTSDSIQKTGGLTQKRFPKIEDYLNLIPETPLQNYSFRNKGDLTFENTSTAWGLVEQTYSNGAVYADFDNDGDLDLVMNNLDHPAYIYKNRAVEQNKGAWIQFKLEGAAPNTQAIGAKIRFQTSTGIYADDLNVNRGFLSSVEPIFHFGLNNSSAISKVEIEFPGNQLVVMENVAPNKRYTVKIADAHPGKLSPLENPAPLFQDITPPAFTHKEDDIQDFNRERLLPWRMSTPGPALAAGDVNKDGLDDFYVGNASGTPGALFIQKGAGNFQASSSATWEKDKIYEDAGAVFLDADGDGDLDLWVSSGGNSFDPNSANYTQRLYTNDGKGNFQRNISAIPEIVSSCAAVSAFDIDNDGDQDILLGGWCTPLAYPKTPTSYILRNTNGKFDIVTDQISKDFKKIGMVRGICWADLNGDQKPECIVTGEWMPIQVFTLQNGQLQLATEKFGLQNTEGIWRSVFPADVDNDGDMDLIAGNIGLNTRYTASVEAPLRLYAKDFDNNESMDPIMTQVQNGREVSVAMRDILLKQLPGLKKKYVRYEPYAQATISDLFDAEALKSADQFKANTLASTVFINEGGQFKARPLPNLAQVSPIYGIQANDIGNDGKTDLILVGNDYGQQTETGRLDAGNGVVLRPDGKGGFQALPAIQSGFWASREARGVKILKAGARTFVVVANNNGPLNVFEIK